MTSSAWLPRAGGWSVMISSKCPCQTKAVTYRKRLGHLCLVGHDHGSHRGRRQPLLVVSHNFICVGWRVEFELPHPPSISISIPPIESLTFAFISMSIAYQLKRSSKTSYRSHTRGLVGFALPLSIGLAWASFAIPGLLGR